MNCIKRLGARVMARGFESQVNELHIRAAILNRFTELGRPQTVAVAWSRLEFGGVRFKFGLCNKADAQQSSRLHLEPPVSSGGLPFAA